MESKSFENRKAKTHKGRLHQKAIMSKIVEDPKECVFINTHNSNEILRMVVNDLVNKKIS
jgi:hypothetical protein